MTQLVLGQILNGAIIGAMYGIIALGITLTFGITGIVNFALGEFMMIGAYVTYTLAERYSGLWNIRFDETGEAVFDFDVLHMRKGGAISATRVTPK